MKKKRGEVRRAMMQSVAPKVVASMRVSTCLAPVAWNGIIPLHQRRIFPCRSSKADPIVLYLYRAYKRYQYSGLLEFAVIDNFNAPSLELVSAKEASISRPVPCQQCRSCHCQISQYSQYSQSVDAMMVQCSE